MGQLQQNVRADDDSLFLEVLPHLVRHARRKFAWLRPADRDEAIAETVAQAFVSYRSLIRRGRAEVARSHGFIGYSIKAAASGRRVGNPTVSTDVYARRRLRNPRCPRKVCGEASRDARPSEEPRGIIVGRLDAPPRDADGDAWLAVAVTARQTTVPNLVRLRIDGGRWLASLPNRHRRMVRSLASGERANRVARRHGVTPGRLSQLRRQWLEAWRDEVGFAA